MDIKRVAIDAVNETIVMTVVHMDYKGQVAKRINEKMPLAQVKGFRKGAVPKDLVEKQYGKAIKIEEVKKEHDIKQLIKTQNELLNSENKINNELYYIKENYNTVLFEKLSSQNTDKSIIKDNLTTQNVKEKYVTYEKELAKIQKEKEDFYKRFSDSKSVKDLILYINDNKQQINDF